MNPRTFSRRIAPVLLSAVLLGALVYGLGSARGRGRASSSPDRAPAEEVSPFEVEGTRIKVRKPDGSFAADSELVGAVLVARDGAGIRSSFRIDAATVDTKDPSGEVVLYSLSSKDPTTGLWKNACMPDMQGVAMGFPLAGVWTDGGEHRRAPGQFEMTCTAGAYGKCVRWGYKPWKSQAMWERHQACTRMVRADYCGDGIGHTRNGTPIDVFDDAGIQLDEPAPQMSFEAGWGKDGAVCVAKTRLPDLITLDGLRAACPGKLQDWLGKKCSEARARLDPRTLLMNKS